MLKLKTHELRTTTVVVLTIHYSSEYQMFQSQTPDGRPSRQQYHAWSMPRPSKLRGWITALPYGLHTHHLGATKPCTDRFTNGQVMCGGCISGRTTEYRAYLPLLTQTNNRKVVIINEDQWCVVREWDVWTEVELVRSKDYHGSVIVRQIPDGQRTTRPAWMETMPPEDISGFLLNLWQIPDLTRWVAAQTPTPVVDAATPPVPPVPPVAKKSKPPKPHPEIPGVLDPAKKQERAEMFARNKKIRDQWLNEHTKENPTEPLNGTH